MTFIMDNINITMQTESHYYTMSCIIYASSLEFSISIAVDMLRHKFRHKTYYMYVHPCMSYMYL